jgi:hypothetical protein
MNTSTLLRMRRPLAVQALNAGGRLLEKTGLLNLQPDENSLLQLARKRTGLEDFGDDFFREPLRRLLDSLRAEARLNTIGQLAARQDILQTLINRLHIQRDRTKHPKIAAQKIIAPLFIIGLPRTGTTLLHSLLALDSANRVPLTWEVMSPSPPTSGEEQRRISRAASDLAWLNRLIPDFKAVHLTGAELPQECVAILSHTFMSDQFDTMFNVPAYRDWQERQEMRPAYEYHRQFLQHLQFRRPGRWVLKAPAHMLMLDALFAVYPDARVVQTHREPLEVLPSTTSLSTLLRGTFSDHVDPALIGRETSQFWADTLETFMRLRAGHSTQQFFDLTFEEILRDPIDAVRRLYGYFGDELTAVTESRMREFLASNPRDKHGRHRYTLEQFGLDPASESPRFTRYRERFHLANPEPLGAA